MDKDKENTQREMDAVVKRLDNVEGRLAFVETQVSLIRKDKPANPEKKRRFRL